jgi:hypothetical protein
MGFCALQAPATRGFGELPIDLWRRYVIEGLHDAAGEDVELERR